MTLRRRSFAIGCALSFCLGVGLFGSVYLMPVFLAFVRRHDAFEIGTIMLVTGVAQLVTAPFAAVLESRIGARWLTAAGFALFALGLGLSAVQPRTADFDEMFWPQIVRGVAIMFCLLPPTRIALGALPQGEVADASGLFNLMRNLGGAIGIALIDTILYGRSTIHAEDFRARLLAGTSAQPRRSGLIRHCCSTARRDRLMTPRSRSSAPWSRRPRWRLASTKPGRCSPASRSRDCCWCRSRGTKTRKVKPSAHWCGGRNCIAASSLFEL